jgi:hypothetical protein
MARRVEAHCIAGLAGIVPFISAGTRNMETAIEKLLPGVEATHWLQVRWKGARDAILKRAKAAGDKPIVVLVGHSKGAQKIIFIARDLQKHGISVHYLAGVDPTALLPGEEVMAPPESVGLVHEFWSTRGFPMNWPLLNRKVFPGGRGGGKYVVPRHWSPDRHKIFEIDAGHVPIMSHAKTRKIILDTIDGVVP